jgi:hypothetical protein
MSLSFSPENRVQSVFKFATQPFFVKFRIDRFQPNGAVPNAGAHESRKGIRITRTRFCTFAQKRVAASWWWDLMRK